MTRADADMTSDAFDVSGSLCRTRIAIELAIVPKPSAIRRMPIPRVPNFSNLTNVLAL